VWRSQNPRHPDIDFRPAPPADQLFSHRAFLTSFGLFHSPVPKVVRDHVLGTENLTRFDGLVREMTSTRGRPKGVSIEEGIRVLFHRDKLNDPIAEGAIEAAIQYNPKGEIRAPGSGINFFMTLNSLHTSTTEYLTSAYTQFSRGTGSNGEASLIDALQVYLQTTLGRHPSPEEIWAYLQKGRPGFPVRDAVIEALGVRPDEFDQVMQRAAKEGAFGEALRSSEFRSSRRRELLERR
jgi:hypothetical protein